MADVVMRGQTLTAAPSERVATLGASVDAVQAFDGQAGALGYALGHVAAAVWGDAPDIASLSVSGVAPTADNVRSGAYPFTAAYYLVYDKALPKTSPVRALVDAMLSAAGQAVARGAGYVPVAADPPPVTVAAPTPKATLSGPAATYTVNPLTLATVTESVTAPVTALYGATSRCAVIERGSLQGLADTQLAGRLATEFRARQDAFLKEYWGVDKLTPVVACPTAATAPPLTLTAALSANFAGVVSLVSDWTIPGAAPVGHDPAATLNVRLDTGAELKFADLFVPGTNLGRLVAAEAARSDPWANEQMIGDWIEQLGAQPGLPFTFSGTSARLYLPGASSLVTTGIDVPFASRWQSVAAFTLAADATGLYTGPATATCPVLTSYAAGNCWSPAPDVEVSAPFSGGELSVTPGFGPDDDWRAEADAGVSVGPTSGHGPATLTLTVAPNGSALSRQLTVHLEWVDGRRGYTSTLRIAQAGRVAPAAPAIAAANATLVRGTVTAPADPSTLVHVTWPDTTQSAPVAVAPDGTWSVTTPAGLGSGAITVVAENDAGTSPKATGVLDTVVPAAPAVTTANGARVAGLAEADTSVVVTWPDGTTAQPVTATRGTWLVPVPVGMSAGTLSVVARDAAGNDSAPVATSLDVTAPPAPAVTVADLAEVAGTATTEPDTTVTLAWPDGTLTQGVLIAADGTWVAPTPAGMTTGVAGAKAVDLAGNESAVVSRDLTTVHPDPARSALTTAVGTIVVTDSPCATGPEVSPGEVEATVRVVDTHGQPMAGTAVVVTAAGGFRSAETRVTTDETGVATVVADVDEAAILAGIPPELTAQADLDGHLTRLADPVELRIDTRRPALGAASARATFLPASGVPADNASAYALSVFWADGCGVPVTDGTVEFTVSGTATLSDATVTPNEYGVATVWVRDSAPETVTVAARVVGADGTETEVTGLGHLTFVPPVPDLLQSSLITAGALTSVPCGGKATTTVTAMVKDALGHPLPGQTVVFATDDGVSLAAPVGVTGLTGTATVPVTSTAPGSHNVTASLGGRPLTGSPVNVTFVSACAPADRSMASFAVSEGPQVADGTGAYQLTVYARDVNGGGVTGLGGSVQVSASDPAVMVGDVTDRGDGSYAVLVKATAPGTFDVDVRIGQGGEARDLAGSPVALRFLPEWQTTVAQTPAGPGAAPARADGEDTQAVTVIR
ncbi:MAG: Ig-like domain-containing protein, partial [Propionibacteriaceae bacterium]|nr:Ig-like domain-containing protein [Propionibacteriaceae bacterium]